MLIRFPQNELLLILIIIMTIFLAGCSSLTPDIDLNRSQANNDAEIQKISLNTAIALLNSDDGLRMGRQPGYTIHNIIGRDITQDGQASIWIISVNSSESFYFIYSDGHITTMKWEEPYKDHTINLTRILTPDRLFEKQEILISNLTSNGKMTLDELELRNGIYFLRGYQPGNIWEYTFDSTTGKQLT